MAKAYRLCYMDGEYQGFMYFTDNFKGQWGDDWDDAPYNCNASAPYEYVEGESPEWNEGRGHIKVYGYMADICDVQTQAYGGYSVEQINKLRVPWMYSSKKATGIYGGYTVAQVVRWCRENGIKIGEIK